MEVFFIPLAISLYLLAIHFSLLETDFYSLATHLIPLAIN